MLLEIQTVQDFVKLIIIPHEEYFPESTSTGYETLSSETTMFWEWTLIVPKQNLSYSFFVLVTPAIFTHVSWLICSRRKVVITWH